MKGLYIIILLCGLCSCGSTTSLLTESSFKPSEVLTTPEVGQLTKGEFAVKYDKVFETILVMLQEERCFIESADKQSGLIVAKQFVPETGSPLDCKRGENRHFSVLLIKKNEKATEVLLTIYLDEIVWASVKDREIYSHRERGLVIEKGFYDRWFDNLAQRLGL